MQVLRLLSPNFFKLSVPGAGGLRIFRAFASLFKAAIILLSKKVKNIGGAKLEKSTAAAYYSLHGPLSCHSGEWKGAENDKLMLVKLHF